MNPPFTVSSIEEYLALPRLDMPAVTQLDAPGIEYEVHKVGFFLAQKERLKVIIPEAEFDSEAGGFLFPTIVIIVSGKKTLFSLPYSLTGWAKQCVVMAHSIANPFPSVVEFGILNDRHYADIK